MEKAESVTSGTPARIAVNLIDRGNNPRTRFDETAMDEMVASFRAHGILQPILLRPSGESRFQIIAGERRFRAFTTVYGMGVDISIPALVVEMDDAQADMSALIENVIREKMTPVEEAEAAARVLGYSQGDRDEAARKLGWERKFLDRRIALMYAIDEVRQALQDEKILLGHAELLAGLRKETQKQVLTALLSSAEKPTVAQLKDRLEKAALSLVKAIFEKSQCTDCQHNSGNQQALFAEAISDGNCTHKPCFERKTERELGIRARALEADYQVVRIVYPGDNFTVVQLAADGVRGVGQEQAAACRSCKDYGAVVSALPDKLGASFKGMCMNTVCNNTKVADRIMGEKAAASALADQTIAKAQDDTKAKAKSPSQAATSASEVKAGTSKVQTGAVKAPVSSEPSNALKEYREKVWRSVLSRVIARLDPETNQCVMLALAAFSPRVIDSTALLEAITKSSILLQNNATDIGVVLDSAMALDNDALKKALSLIPASISKDLEIRQVVSLLKGLDVKLEEHWKVNDEVFGLLTKNEIDATCGEIGIKAAIGTGYPKLIGGKKDDLVRAILTITGFEYKGRIPKQMRW